MTATLSSFIGFGLKAPRWQLVQQILKRSKADTWTLAVREWKLTSIERSEYPHTCLCTHYPIKDLCYLYNSKTDEIAMVGNCCVRLFQSTSISLDGVFRALARGKLNMSLISYAYKNKIIDDWEYNFSCNTLRKRLLTRKQQGMREEITKRIFKKLGVLTVTTKT